MSDPKDELIQRQSKAIVSLTLIIIVLIICLFLMAYCERPGKEAASDAPKTDAPAAKNTAAAADSKGAKLFKQNCAVCHAAFTDQKLTGPGLKGIFDRVPQPADTWLHGWILNNEKVIKSGDAYAKKIYADNGKATMTVFEGQLSDEDIKEILTYLKGGSSPLPAGAEGHLTR